MKPHSIVSVEYHPSYGNYTLALYRNAYVAGDGLAIEAIDITDPGSEDYLTLWSTITVNLPDDPKAVEWCATEGHIIIDSNNNSKELLDALVAAGIIALTGDSCRSGYCRYPLAVVSADALARMDTLERTVERLTGQKDTE